MTSLVGVDVGATLCKLVRVNGASVDTALVASANVEGIRARVQSWAPTRIGATGGGADRLGPSLTLWSVSGMNSRRSC